MPQTRKPGGWSDLGKTDGWKRDGDEFYERNDAAKEIWGQELVKQACVQLGSIRRIVLSFADGAVDRARRINPKTQHNTSTFQQRFRSARGGVSASTR